MSEQALQRTIVDYLNRCVPPPPGGPFWTAINPVPAKSKAVAGMSKAMGMRAGVPDMLLVFKGRAYFLEFKFRNGRLSKTQKHVLAEICQARGDCAIIRSLDDLNDFFDVIGIPVRARAE